MNPTPSTTPQASPGAMRASAKLRELIEIANAHKWGMPPDDVLASVIDRETHAAQLLAQLENLVFRFDHMGEESSEDAADLDAAKKVIDAAKGSTQAATEAAFGDALLRANLEEVRRQRDNLQAQVNDLVALVQAFPGQLLNARLDAQRGEQTVYNYEKAARACAPRV